MEIYFQRQVHNALDLVNNFQGTEPFHHYLKSQFAKNKHWGSKDRKRYRALCYLYWRYYKVLRELPLQEQSSFLYQAFQENTTQFTKAYNDWSAYLSKCINIEDLNSGFAAEPPVFMRLKKESWKNVEAFIEQNQIPSIQFDEIMVQFQSQVELNPLVENGHGFIQDISSQLAMRKLSETIQPKLVWDTCSGAGGKSLDLAFDIPNVKLFCSDRRSSILLNLRERFKTLNLSIPETAEFDLLDKESSTYPPMIQQDLILADVPCTGSGTWRRNPENIAFFNPQSIETYQNIQYSILEKLAPFVQKGNHLYYLTCSVFEAENELNTQKFCKQFKFEVVFENYFGGRAVNGDTIYGCLMQRK